MSTNINHKTMGQASIEAQQKDPNSRYVMDVAAEAQQDHMEEIIWCIKHAQKKVDCSKRKCTRACDKHIMPVEDCYSLTCADYCKTRAAYMDDIYIVYETKQEKLMPNVFRNYFEWRISCPTPTYDTSVFKYIHSTGDLEYLWTIPDRETCHYLLNNAAYVAPEEQQLLEFVQQFSKGLLFKKMKDLNGERYDSPELLTKKA